MKRLRLITLTITLAFLLSYVAPAIQADGIEREGAGSFLLDGVGARPLAMGGSFVAIADDATAAYWNPAGLGQIEGSGLSAMYADRFNTGLRYQFLSLVGGGFGVSLLRLNAADVLYVTRRDSLGHPVRDDGTVKHSENALLATYGVRLNSNLYIGLTGKGFYHELLENTAKGWGIDAGALFRNELFSVGIAVQNIKEGRLIWDDLDETEDTIPMNVKAGGAAYLVNGMVIAAADVDIMKDKQILHLGAEAWPLRDVLALRVGLQNTDFSAGLGVRAGSFGLDYALQTHTLGLTHRASINLLF